MIYGLTIAIITIWIDIKTDFKIWLKSRNLYLPNGSINHKKGAVLRSAGMVPATLLISWSHGWYKIVPVWYDNIYWIAGGMSFFWYLTFFDGILNLKEGEGFFRVGTTAGTDKIQKNWPIWLRAIVKIGGIILFTFLFIKLKKLYHVA